MKSIGIKALTVVTLSATAIALHAAAGRDIKSTVKTAVQTCTGAKATCAATVNAVGEVATFDVKTATAKDLGTITSETKVTVELPKEPNATTLYSLTPSTGESKDKKIYILFKNVPQPKGTRLAGQSVVLAYRQFEGEKSNQWVEVGRIQSNVPLATAEVTLSPEGRASVVNPNKPTEMINFDIQKKNLKA